ncbi:MAPEG family protein [Herbaspirillum sp. AP02]|uniref:MAPEG family protein n=1 Tax=unclassified Herbaspirillum TaxID=2624150 RepID=UPI0015DA10C8|nr:MULTISPECIES: MAPEG family protein [unclassified Herbaspirillum]MBG7621030.1 MAPEG family protein [Herbaspirillum sp. AP02]NZD68759.1 MAPEG family protein [Herbaspirillum sp. AP21]
MTLSNWCILIAGLMPVFTIVVAKRGRKDFDNAEPRAWLDQQTGVRRRADYAHRNHFEAFPFFAAAVLVAQQAGAAQGQIDIASVVFIAARLLYTLFYLNDKPSARSAVWSVGYLSVIALFVIAARA